jgi:hypothetical protein
VCGLPDAYGELQRGREGEGEKTKKVSRMLQEGRGRERERERKNTTCLLRPEGEKKCYCLGEEMMVPREGSCCYLK